MRKLFLVVYAVVIAYALFTPVILTLTIKNKDNEIETTVDVWWLNILLCYIILVPLCVLSAFSCYYLVKEM